MTLHVRFEYPICVPSLIRSRSLILLILLVIVTVDSSFGSPSQHVGNKTTNLPRSRCRSATQARHEESRWKLAS